MAADHTDGATGCQSDMATDVWPPLKE